METLLQGALFGATFLAGVVPTLLANAINAGSPFKTTYGEGDVTPPEFSLDVIWQYLADMQFSLLVVTIAATVMSLRSHLPDGIKQVALVTAVNLLVNLAFFLSHPVFTSYYLVPIAMLSLWSLLFAFLMRPAEAVDGGGARQVAVARS
jgi:hypothetical protein